MKTLEIKRPNGEIELVDVTNNFSVITENLLDQIRTSTKKAGKGDVIRAIITETKSNLMQLRREYNDLHNEGGEGYMPENDYFTTKADYKEWTETKEVR